MPEQLPAPGSFADKVQMLDAALTRKNAQTVAQTWRNKQGRLGKPIDWLTMQDSYYLSDGGYSRIHCTKTGRLFLTSNSRPEVKDGWRFCAELIADIEREIESAAATAGWILSE